MFPCQRWLAKDEDDGAIERELVSDTVFEEVVRRDGSVKTKELQRRNTLSGNYTLLFSRPIRGLKTTLRFVRLSSVRLSVCSIRYGMFTSH